MECKCISSYFNIIHIHSQAQCTCAASGSLLDNVTQLAVADERAFGVLAVAVETDVWVQVTFVHIWEDRAGQIICECSNIQRLDWLDNGSDVEEVQRISSEEANEWIHFAHRKAIHIQRIVFSSHQYTSSCPWRPWSHRNTDSGIPPECWCTGLRHRYLEFPHTHQYLIEKAEHAFQWDRCYSFMGCDGNMMSLVHSFIVTQIRTYGTYHVLDYLRRSLGQA